LSFFHHNPVRAAEKKRLIVSFAEHSSMSSRLTLTVLVDNTTLSDHDLCGESGLSILLETDGKKILLDTGLSGLFQTNAEKMGIDLWDLNCIVLSHGHIDHTGGLFTLARYFAYATPEGRQIRVPELIAHSRCFWPKEKDARKNGSAVSEEEARRHFMVTLSDGPVWITDNLVFLGEIPRNLAFERSAPGKRRIQRPDGKNEPDHLLDDSALVFRSSEGLVIITGCSHAGICNITEYAREVCREKRVIDIIGGFHLIRPEPERLEKTGLFLGRLSLKALHACHCTSLAAKIALAAHCPVEEVGVGLRLAWQG
jgi:7,8-dihydropterin-6-yl-methyl-4-(beta-D-ribofuranosyl)aminobenzene 5'-phosphate synthase